MNRSVKRLKELDIILNRENVQKITEAIEVLRYGQPLEGAISLLVSLYNRSDDSSIKSLITSFMNDIKDQSACSEVMAEIRKEASTGTLRMLISSCWQSGLNYAEYSADFIEIFLLTDDYLTAFECFTVLEPLVQDIPKSRRDEIIQVIRAKTPVLSNDLRALRLELISVLE
jgi:hypothetical protein